MEGHSGKVLFRPGRRLTSMAAGGTVCNAAVLCRFDCPRGYG
jgi:hypothetical protein